MLEVSLIWQLKISGFLVLIGMFYKYWLWRSTSSLIQSKALKVNDIRFFSDFFFYNIETLRRYIYKCKYHTMLPQFFGFILSILRRSGTFKTLLMKVSSNVIQENKAFVSHIRGPRIQHCSSLCFTDNKSPLKPHVFYLFHLRMLKTQGVCNPFHWMTAKNSYQ